MADRLIRSTSAPFDMGLASAEYLWREVNRVPVGAFAWTGYAGDTIQMHYAGLNKHWMTRRFLHTAFTYCFDQLKVKAILAFLPEDRVYARDIAIRLGFRSMGLVPGVRLHMLTMVREDCRWLNYG